MGKRKDKDFGAGLEPGQFVQGNLFEQNQHPQQEALDQTIDTIRAQFGTGSIGRGILLNRRSAENGNEQFE